MDYTDKPTDIRKGEDLDWSKVESYLRDSIDGLEGPMQVKQYPSGFSNLTYSVKVGGTDMILRRPPFGTKPKSGHDMHREYKVLSALHPVFPYCPKPLAYTEDPEVMGCPFYVMERIQGVIIRRELPPGMKLTEQQSHTLCRRLLEVQYELHSIDYAAVGLADLGKPEGYVRRQVEGWSRRYVAARTPDVPTCEEVMAWLAEKMPPESDMVGIIHNDYKLDNVVLDSADPTRIVGVLDWEMTTLGDPLMDVGSSLAYWTEAGDPDDLRAIKMMPTDMPGMPTRRELVDRYGKLAGCSIDNFDFYYAFGLFRLAVIAQQIYYRYYHGQTQDERFQALQFVVTTLDKQANRVMAASGI